MVLRKEIPEAALQTKTIMTATHVMKMKIITTRRITMMKIIMTRTTMRRMKTKATVRVQVTTRRKMKITTRTTKTTTTRIMKMKTKRKKTMISTADHVEALQPCILKKDVRSQPEADVLLTAVAEAPITVVAEARITAAAEVLTTVDQVHAEVLQPWIRDNKERSLPWADVLHTMEAEVPMAEEEAPMVEADHPITVAAEAPTTVDPVHAEALQPWIRNNKEKLLLWADVPLTVVAEVVLLTAEEAVLPTADVAALIQAEDEAAHAEVSQPWIRNNKEKSQPWEDALLTEAADLPTEEVLLIAEEAVLQTADVALSV
jgi:hypothetical protein